MSYFLGDKPLDTKGKSNEEVKAAIASDAAPGASELKKEHPDVTSPPGPISAPTKPKKNDMDAAIAKIGASVVGLQRGLVDSPPCQGKACRDWDKPATRKERLTISVSGREKQKTQFPPGLVVSEKAKAKMEEQQAKIAEKQQEKETKKAEQDARWQGRADVVTRWKKWEEKQQSVKDGILAKWEARDNRLAEKRAARLAKLAEKPEELEKEKKKLAEEDVKERLMRAKYMDQVEEKQLKALKKREHAQVRRDKVFNFFGGFLGWKERAIPEIPQKTLEDWSLAGFSDLGEVDTKLSLLILLIVGYAVFAATKTPANPVPVATKKLRSRKKKRK